MTSIKASQAESFVKAPPANVSAFLLYGPDAGLVSERARILAQTLAKRSDPPGDIVRLDDADLEEGTERLLVELQTISMFGGRKVVRAQAGRRINAALVKGLIDGGGLEGVLIVEAGNLKTDEGVRAPFEKSAAAVAVACFPDSEGDLAQLAQSVLKEAGLRIGGEALDVLVARLGADRALSRAELDKLALYAAGQAEVTADDVDAVVGDASDLQLDRVAQAVASGELTRALADAERALAAGESAPTIVLSVQRYFSGCIACGPRWTVGAVRRTPCGGCGRRSTSSFRRR